ncbi:MAG TPA: cytochrome c [Gammaproteobacteria bacterium]|nr:cytochrome c [Gammaproteobacteria bacterium]
MTQLRQILSAFVLLCFACCGPAAAQSARKERAAVANGEAVYLRVGCPACHGTVGQGGAGPRLAPGTLPPAAFAQWVRNGTPNFSFGSGMPAFPASAISDADLADVRAYLASVPKPPPVADIPLLAR